MVANRSGQAGENLVLFLSLVPYVMDRGEVSLEEAAVQFGRSPDDIRKAVELIACAGVPGDSAAYLHADLFDIDWSAWESEGIIRFENTSVLDHQPRFSPREIAALIAGLQYLAAHPRYGEREDVQRLLAKLRDASGHPNGDTMVVKSGHVESSRGLLDGAIGSGHQVSFDYLASRGDSERRTVDPIALEVRDGTWYLRGWCHSREALRVFRLDRMNSPEVLDAPVGQHPDVSQPESWKIFEPSATDVLVTIECEESALALIAEYLDRGHPPQKEGDVYVATIAFAHTHSLARFIASHPGVVRVRSPESARLAIRDWASAALAGLQT